MALPTPHGERSPAGSAPHRALFLSDVHLGTRRTEARRLLQQLKGHPSEQLVLVGDILDCTAWRKRGAVLSPAEVELLLWLVAAASERQVTWVLGNHERPLQTAMGLEAMGAIREGTPQFQIGHRYIHQARDGRRLAVIHGDCLGHGSGRWQRLDYWGYQALVELERWSRRLGLPSPTVAVQRGRGGQQVIDAFHRDAAAWARRHGFDGVICGHIHSACVKDHGPVRVLNTGCWTHPPGTFLVETAAGCWQLRDGHGRCLARLGEGDECHSQSIRSANQGLSEQARAM